MQGTRFFIGRMTTVLPVVVWIVVQTALGAMAADGGQGTSPLIYSVSVSPEKVAAGDTVQMEAVFSVFDESFRASLPVEYYYEIYRQNQVLFTSPVKAVTAGNGAKTHLAIQVQATGEQGKYTAALKLVQSGRTVGTSAEFSIVPVMEARRYQAELNKKNPASGSSPENRLVGEWEFVSQDPQPPFPRLSISKEDGEMVARVVRENAETLWVKLRKTETGLVIRSKSAQSGGGCWFVMEDVVTFNDRMEEMPVRSRIVEGGKCITVGKAVASTLHRIE